MIFAGIRAGILIQSHSSFHFSPLMRSPLLSDKIEQPLPVGAQAGQAVKQCRLPLTEILYTPLCQQFWIHRLLEVKPDDRNKLGPTEIDTSFQKSIFTIYFFQSSFGETIPYYPFQISWSYLSLDLEWVSPLQNVNFFFFLVWGKKKRKKINVTIVGFNLPFDDSKSLSFYKHKRLWATDTISFQNKAPRPMWTLVDTWSPNVAGHPTDESLIRHCDSHLFPIQPWLQPWDKPTQLLTLRSPRREQRDRGRRESNEYGEDRIKREWEGMIQSQNMKKNGTKAWG